MPRLRDVGEWIENTLPDLLAEHEVPAASVAVIAERRGRPRLATSASMRSRNQSRPRSGLCSARRAPPANVAISASDLMVFAKMHFDGGSAPGRRAAAE